MLGSSKRLMPIGAASPHLEIIRRPLLTEKSGRITSVPHKICPRLPSFLLDQITGASISLACGEKSRPAWKGRELFPQSAEDAGQPGLAGAGRARMGGELEAAGPAGGGAEAGWGGCVDRGLLPWDSEFGPSARTRESSPNALLQRFREAGDRGVRRRDAEAREDGLLGTDSRWVSPPTPRPGRGHPPLMEE